MGHIGHEDVGVACYPHSSVIRIEPFSPGTDDLHSVGTIGHANPTAFALLARLCLIAARCLDVGQYDLRIDQGVAVVGNLALHGTGKDLRQGQP